MEIESLGEEEGLEDIKQPTKVALIDADTLVYAVASTNQYAEDILPKHMYSEEEWEEIVHDPQFDEDEMCIWKLNVAECVEKLKDSIETIKEETFTKDAELYFTHGKNFRYDVYSMYKANRGGSRRPPALLELKSAILEHYKGEICTSIEADDAVVYLKRTQPSKYVLCAVDKDVYKSVPGKHWNYYSSVKYNIPRKWVETTKEDAARFPYIQTLMGDSTDNIPGCKGIGARRAEKLLLGLQDSKEMWDVVVATFESKGLTIKDAIRDMRLVNMHQVSKQGKEWKWETWVQPLQ